MRLAAFIEARVDGIVEPWRTSIQRATPDGAGRADPAQDAHAREVLLAIVAHMRHDANEEERSAGPRIESMNDPTGPQTAAGKHGVARHLAGFDLDEVVSEFRVLRAIVLARWRHDAARPVGDIAAEEIARFHEGVDQALAESIHAFSATQARSRDMFLAVLGHDLRGPLSGINMSADLLALPAMAEPVRLQVAARIRRASSVMTRLTTDLLEYARSRLGAALPIARSACDLRAVCEEAIDFAGAAYPALSIDADFSGDLRAHCDAARLQQVLGNLLSNAVQHGEPGRPVSLVARRDEQCVVIVVANRGKVIPREAFAMIFEPMCRLPLQGDETFEQRTRVGLGLSIVRQIVEGHGGTVSVESSAEATAFTVRLPDAPPASAEGEPTDGGAASAG